MDSIAPGSIAVIFTSQRRSDDPAGYAVAAAAMDAAAAAMPGYLGVDSVRDGDGYGITVSYWCNRVSAEAWRDDPRHREIRESGRACWYDRYTVHVAAVERGYRWERADPDLAADGPKKGPAPEGPARKVLGEDA